MPRRSTCHYRGHPRTHESRPTKSTPTIDISRTLRGYVFPLASATDSTVRVSARRNSASTWGTSRSWETASAPAVSSCSTRREALITNRLLYSNRSRFAETLAIVRPASPGSRLNVRRTTLWFKRGTHGPRPSGRPRRTARLAALTARRRLTSAAAYCSSPSRSGRSS